MVIGIGKSVLSYVKLQEFRLHRGQKRVIVALIEAPKRAISSQKVKQLCSGNKDLTELKAGKRSGFRPPVLNK